MQFTILLKIRSKEINIAVTWWKNILTKNLWWLKKTIKILRTLLNVQSVTMIILTNDVKVRNHCHITGKYRGSVHTDCNINLKFNHKIPVKFNELKLYDLHLIMQELGKFNLKINVIPNGLWEYMSFTINNRLRFIGSFQFLSSSLDNFVKNLNKNDFKYLSHEFHNNLLDLVR